MAGQRLAFIHPRDARPAGKYHGGSRLRARWSQIKDCFTGKGPDVFVGLIDDRGRPLKTGYWRDRRVDRNISSARGLGRHGYPILYDHRTRQYGEWYPEMWLDAKYCTDVRHNLPWMIQDGCLNIHYLDAYHPDDTDATWTVPEERMGNIVWPY